MKVMSNPWAKSFEEMRAPYLQEKKAKKDYDGDGKIESGSKEIPVVPGGKICSHGGPALLGKGLPESDCLHW